MKQKRFVLVLKVFSFRFAKQTSKDVVDTTINTLSIEQFSISDLPSLLRYQMCFSIFVQPIDDTIHFKI